MMDDSEQRSYQTVTLTTEVPIDIRRTLGVLGHGSGDPSMHVGRDGSVWRAMNTPELM